MNEEKREATVTRFEVIDHRPIMDDYGHYTVAGRVVVAYGINIELSYQDDGRTLKVFITEARTDDGSNHES